jgi:hypothetical protein
VNPAQTMKRTVKKPAVTATAKKISLMRAIKWLQF